MDKRTILLRDYSFVFLLFGPKTKSNETKRLSVKYFPNTKIYFGPKLISCYISLYDHGNLNKLVKIYQLNFYSKQAFQLLGSGALKEISGQYYIRTTGTVQTWISPWLNGYNVIVLNW